MPMENGVEDTFFKMKSSVCCNGRMLDFSTPKIMGILNLAPDSFFDGGKYKSENEVIGHVSSMISEGASIIDIGAQSTRPNAALIPPGEEWQRMEKLLKKLRKEFPSAVFSVDTFYGEVAANAVAEGVDIVNDISGGTMDPEMFTTMSKLKIPYILMHIKGTPQTMQTDPHYKNVINEVLNYFAERIQQLLLLGVHDIIIDPGFGFGKTMEHNFELLHHLDLLKIFERPVLAGLSRKSMVNKILNSKAEEALNGTTILNTIALMNGANILRVHDVKEAVEAVKLVTCGATFKNNRKK